MYISPSSYETTESSFVSTTINASFASSTNYYETSSISPKTTRGSYLAGSTLPTTTLSTWKPTLTTLDLALLIGIPCLSLVFCCCICAFCCVKCTVLRNKALQKLGNPWSWDMPSKSKPKHGFEPAVNENIHHSGPPTIHNFAVSNHYMDIKQLAAQNKKDYWEVTPKNLIVHDSEVLGNGAFAYVCKGTLTGKIPLLKAQAGISLTLEHRHDGHCEGGCIECRSWLTALAEKARESEKCAQSIFIHSKSSSASLTAAVKRLPPHADEQNRLDFFHEMDFMKKLGYHSHIISMLGCVSDPSDPLIVVELCHHGDLLKFLRLNRENVERETDPTKNDLRIKDLVSIAWQISDGMSYLSSKGFIHRDVAARNVLLTKNMVAKVSDFGLCRYVDSSLYTAKGGKLPIKWMAVESLKFYEYTTKSDVWAYGVALFEIFSLGDGPYQAIQPLEMLKYLEDGNRMKQPTKCPNEIYSLMLRCWKANKDDRPTFDEIRGELTLMLNLTDEHYGYLKLDSEENESIPRDRVDQRRNIELLYEKCAAPHQDEKYRKSQLDGIKREECPEIDDALIDALHHESNVFDQKKEDSEERENSRQNETEVEDEIISTSL